MPAEGSRQPARSAGGVNAGEVDRIERVLAAAVRRTCPAWLAGDAEDLVQEALVKIVQIVRRDEGNVAFGSSYLWRVAHSAVIDEIRRRRRSREDAFAEAGSDPAVEAPDPERVAFGRRLGVGIRSCLGGLVEARRRAVTLRLLGHSVAEAAALLGWAVKRTENLVYRGLADLRKCLRSKGLHDARW